MSSISTLVDVHAIAFVCADTSADASMRASLRVGVCAAGRCMSAATPAEKLAVYAAHSAAFVL